MQLALGFKESKFKWPHTFSDLVRLVTFSMQVGIQLFIHSDGVSSPSFHLPLWRGQKAQLLLLWAYMTEFIVMEEFRSGQLMCISVVEQSLI